MMIIFIMLQKNCVKTQLVPAVFIFGDSIVDVGNNNNLPTLVKANFPPYGRDFANHRSTGRFSNGKLAIDYLVDTLQLGSYPQAYLSTHGVSNELLIGANFASAASGYDDSTANLYLAISLSKQLEYYGEYQSRVVGMIGQANASSIFSNALYIISAGTSDLIQNYYISPILQATYPNIHQYFNTLLRNYEQFIENLHSMGARRIGVASLAPLGCLPGAITIFGFGNNNQCVDRLNYDAMYFNTRLNSTSQILRNRLSNLNLLVLDIYQPLYNLIVNNPIQNGFYETRKGCCGLGTIETALLCNSLAIGTCSNASHHIFWDAFHPSDAANNLLSSYMTIAGASLLN
ncbi:GDSL esterase/lipase At5g03810-like [Cannabis sativa]|uniref:GDSL esterase/lipase At5g03810-like n=1 Tax=Cannabis sativa TaxID=3483 RepID=UPI0029CA188F|nr:GDSL esterase/lipase At5g03810-like [Cannabis sativa]